MGIGAKAVLLFEEGTKSSKEICEMYDIAQRTLRRWLRLYRMGGLEAINPQKPGPKKGSHAISKHLEERIIRLKQRHPSWGARRIKYQYDLPASWITVHRAIKRNGLLVRIKAKPQPCRRFQRKHVDSLWQGDTFQFRIRSVGKVYVTGFTDDRSRYRIVSKAYLHKGAEESVNAFQWAIRKGRVPREIYLDNGKQFIARDFKGEARGYGIKLIYGRPYHPRGRGKIEGYHKILYRELILRVEFTSLSHFRAELRKFDERYNNWRKQEIHGWQTPASVYNNPKFFNKKRKIMQSKRGQ